MKQPRLKWPAAHHLACSDDGRLLVCLGRDVVAIDIAARRRAWTVHPLTHPSHAAFSPGAAELAVKATSGRIVILDPRNGEVLHDHENQADGEGSGVAFCPDGDKLVDGSWAGALTVRHARDGSILVRETFPGEMISRITHDRSRRTWLVEHTPTIRPGRNTPAPTYVSVRRWPFSPDTTRRLSLGRRIQSATLSPDGSRLCFIQMRRERRVRIAQVSNGRILASSGALEAGGTGSELAWSGDGRYVGAVSEGMVVVFRASDLAVVGRVPAQYPSSLAFVPGGDALALGGWTSSALLKLSDVVEGRGASG